MSAQYVVPEEWVEMAWEAWRIVPEGSFRAALAEVRANAVKVEGE